MSIIKILENKGQVLVIFSVMFIIFCGIGGIVVDVGNLYFQRHRMSTACDAAAIAGAYRLPNTSLADTTAKQYASRNGFTNGVNNVTVTTLFIPPDKFRVIITRNVKHYFMKLLGAPQTSLIVQATAQFFSLQPINCWGTGTYGTIGTQSLEISGPMARYDYGDPYSTVYNNGLAYNPNVEYDPSGYNYCINVPNNYFSINGTTNLRIDLFDATSGTSGRDEVYTAHGTSVQATTVYTLYKPDLTPSDYSDDVQIASVTIGPNNSTYRNVWATPPGFSFNTATNGGSGCYRLNVRTISGSGGNAYHIRAGPPSATFNPANGTTITATGRLQMFFLSSGTVNVNLGYIPREAAGMRIHINKFDTDIGAQSITYTDSTGMINQQGTLSTNGTWKEDVFTIPAGYQGGNLFVRYTAGKNDTSVWYMWYEGTLPGQAGKVRLVE